MDRSLVNIYASQADRKERDPIAEDNGRATVPMGRGFAMWRRMNPGTELVWIDDMDGNPKAVTPKQAVVASLALSLIDGEMLTMREMAAQLGYSPSTVSRAMTKLAAWGIIAYIVGRGRWAGLVIMRRVKGDGLDRFRRAAQARVRGWREAAERRLLSVKINVPSIALEEGRGIDSLYYYFTSTKGATLKEPWSAEDVAHVR